MERLFFQTTSHSFTNPTSERNADLERSYGYFMKQINLRTSKDVLLDCRVSPNPQGNNKLWEIELSFFHVLFRIGRYMIGTPFRGFFACHRQNDFTTYSINIEGREFWFDQCELALASLSEPLGDMPQKQVR